MSAANKRKGTQYETDLLKGLRNEGIDAERLRLAGKDDEGDLRLNVNGALHIIECKNVKTTDLSGWVLEWERERRNYAQARGIPFLPFGAVYHKKRNAGLFEGYATMPIHEHMRLIQMFAPPPF